MFIALWLLTASVAAAGHKAPALTPQQLFESGKYQEAIDKIKARPEAPPDQIYLRVLAHQKAGQNDEAKDVLGTLAAQDEGSAWREIGKSGIALADGENAAAARDATKAVEHDGDLAEARYQLGLVELARNNQPQAAEA